MVFDIVFFLLSIIACIVIIYIITLLRFSNTRNNQMKSFLIFGSAAILWIFFSSLMHITDPQDFVLFFTLHSISACTFPYVFLWYILNYTGSSLVRSKPFICVLFIIPILDALAFATNPLHHLMILSYDFPTMPTGPLFIVHAIFAYAASLWSLIAIFVYVFRSATKTPLVIIATFSILLPFVINLLLMLDMLGTRRDFTPLGFFITFTLFFMTTYRSDPFIFKSIALANIFTSLSDIIVIANTRGVIVDANTAFCETFSKFPLELGKTNVTEFTSWLSSNIRNSNSERMLLEVDDIARSHESGEFSILRKNCTYFENDESNDESILTFTLRRDLIHDKKDPSGYLITMSNVSTYRAMIDEIHQQNERLVELKELAEEASRTKGAFLANMSHEIRTPINAITGMVAIARGTEDLDKMHDCMDKVDAASHQLLSLINDILDMSKIEANHMELASETFEFPALLLNIKNIIEITAAAKNQTLNVAIADDLPNVVIGDDMRLSQIFLNLLSNAVKFTHKGGNISLSAKLLDTKNDLHYFEVKVQDDGIGITEEQQKRLFSSFEQADTSISKRYGGSGLGLVISKRLAEMMSGGIMLESEVGKGSCFTVQFCLETCDEEIIVQGEYEDNYDFSGRTALLVEDIEINREIVLAMLEGSGLHVDYAENGQQAVEIFVANPTKYDIIFMDIQMPVMDGYTATTAIRGSVAPNAGDIPILAMTANAFVEDIAKCHNTGMNDHIAKPIEFDLLFRKIANLIK